MVGMFLTRLNGAVCLIYRRTSRLALVASRFVDANRAFLLAFLPDVDALLGVYRWVTHSLVLTAPLLWAAFRRRVFVLGVLLYMLHIVMDVFTAPTPVLWPVSSVACQLRVDVEGFSDGRYIGVVPALGIVAEPADFSFGKMVEGTVVAPKGTVLALLVVFILLAEGRRWQALDSQTPST